MKREDIIKAISPNLENAFNPVANVLAGNFVYFLEGEVLNLSDPVDSEFISRLHLATQNFYKLFLSLSPDDTKHIAHSEFRLTSQKLNRIARKRGLAGQLTAINL